MNSYGNLESLLEYSPSLQFGYFEFPEDSGDEGEGSDSLGELLREKARCLTDILSQIRVDIESRRQLSTDVLDGISKHYCYLKTKLYELQTWAIGFNRSVEGRRSKLEIQLDALNQESRREQVESWRDVAQLKEEFRKWFKQYRDLLQRVRIILSGKV